MAKLEDLFAKKKEATPILDLSKCTVSSKEEFRKLYDKVPDFKIRPEKVRVEDIKIREKDFAFKMTKKDKKAMKEPYNMADPMPVEMRCLKLEDLASVPIDWKMLTSVRPKSKVDEEFFNRLVELRKSELKSIAREKREAALSSWVRKAKNKSGVLETRVVTCIECGEEYCNGKTCVDYQYECYIRVQVTSQLPTLSKGGVVTAAANALSAAGTKKKRKSRTRTRKKKIIKQRSRSKSQSEKVEKNKSPQRKPHKKVLKRSKSEGGKTKKKKKIKSGSKSD